MNSNTPSNTCVSDMPGKIDPLVQAQDRIKLLEKVLGDVKVRIAFMDWPAESMWQTNGGNWVPDWRKECAWINHALHGTPIDESELASLVSFPANSLPTQDRKTDREKQ